MGIHMTQERDILCEPKDSPQSGGFYGPVVADSP